MDLSFLYKLKELQTIITNLAHEDGLTFQTTPQEKTETRERKSHTPPVTTVTRANRPQHGARQARRTPAAEQDGTEVPPRTSPISAVPSADAHAGGTTG